jgi:alpha-amylase
VVVAIENRSRATLETRFGIEWNLMMLGGGGNPDAWYEVAGARTAHDARGDAAGVNAVRQGNDHVGIAIESIVEPTADAWWAPIDTISNSENGFERVYQGSSLVFTWPLRLEPGERRVFRVDHGVTAARDRAIEEARTSAPGAMPA